MVGNNAALNESDNKRQIEVFFTPAAIAFERFRGYNAVVIDVLRAATSIITALNNGARDIIPAESIARAIDLSIELKREDVLLCGEREGRLVDGFHIGNSPADYTRERVRGRTLIFGSTNGAPAIIRAAIARSLYLCAFVNLNAVIDAILNTSDIFPLAIVCAGKLDRFAIEDAVCAGMLIQRLQRRSRKTIKLNDAAQAALLLAKEYGSDIQSLLRNCDHGRNLLEIGMENDLPICAADSHIPVVPILTDGKLIKMNEP